MSFNRINYDQCAYDLKMNRSTLPGDYRLYASYAENCNQCFSADGPINAKSDVSLSRDSNDLSYTNLADVENKLSWRRSKLSECNEGFENLDDKQLRNKPVCNNKLISQDTRFTNPIDNYRGMSLTSYMVNPYLPINPQCIIQNNNDKYGMNSKLFVKDNYEYGNDEPISQIPIYPKEEMKQPSTQLTPIVVYAEANNKGFSLPNECATNNIVDPKCVLPN
jgi:hypothetical protein